MNLTRGHWKYIKDKNYRIALLPWGATEPHNLHLPFGTDTLCSQRISEFVADRCRDDGEEVIVLPGMPYGVNTGQLDLNMCISIRPSVQYQILHDIALAVVQHGVQKLVIVNGHGGNNFKPLLRELTQELPNLFVAFTNWWAVSDSAKVFDAPGDHAGDLETSVMLYLYPDLVLPKQQWGDGKEKRFKPAGLRDGTIWAPRHWRSISTDTGVGDPVKATAEKGKRHVDSCVEILSRYISELASTPIEDLYER